MKRKGFFSIAILVAVMCLSSVSEVQAGGISGVATEWTQLLNNIQLVEANSTTLQQLQNQFQQLSHELTMIQNAEQQTASVTNIDRNPLFASAIQDMMQLSNIVQMGNGLAYSMSNLDQEFNNRFQGFGYTTGASYPGQYRNWLQTSLDTTHAAMSTLGLQGSQLNNDTQLLASLQQKSQNTSGLLDTLQVANQLAAQEILELQKLRQLIMTDIQAKQTYQASQIQNSMSQSDLGSSFLANTASFPSGESATLPDVPQGSVIPTN